MTIHDLYKKCGRGENSMLWDARAWCKNRAARKSRRVNAILREVEEDFGFFGTLTHARESGLSVNILFDDEDAFLRYGKNHIALLRKDWRTGMTFAAQHTAITIEENPRFISVQDLADIASFHLTDEERADIRHFISWNWRLIRALGSTTDPDAPGFVDSIDFYLRRLAIPAKMDFADITPHCTSAENTGFIVCVGVENLHPNIREFHSGNFAIPHAYIWSLDGTLATRFRIDTESQPVSPAALQPLYDTDMPLAEYASALLTWANQAPKRFRERTNWDAMRTSWRDMSEVVAQTARASAEGTLVTDRAEYERLQKGD